MALSLIAVYAEARPSLGDGLMLAQAQQNQRAPMDKDRAAAMVERSTGGQVLSIETAVKGQRLVYRFKVLLSGGRVRIVTVDAHTGDMD